MPPTLNRMFRNLVVVVLALFGDPTYLLRVWLSLLVGVGLVAGGYWFALPEVLPMWPALVSLFVAAVIGIAWERHAANNSRGLR